MSQYILSEWRSDDPEDPFIVFVQIDSERYLERIINVFRDGRVEIESLWEEDPINISPPVPELQFINDQDEFTACYTSASLFETTWKEATDTRRLSPTSINNLTQTLHNPDQGSGGT